MGRDRLALDYRFFFPGLTETLFHSDLPSCGVGINTQLMCPTVHQLIDELPVIKLSQSSILSHVRRMEFGLNFTVVH